MKTCLDNAFCSDIPLQSLNSHQKLNKCYFSISEKNDIRFCQYLAALVFAFCMDSTDADGIIII
jgi:hypothetical protein